VDASATCEQKYYSMLEHFLGCSVQLWYIVVSSVRVCHLNAVLDILQVALSGGILFIVFGIQSYLSPVES